MDIEAIELYCEYEVLIDKYIKGLSLLELFDLKFEILRLRDKGLIMIEALDKEDKRRF